MNENIINFCDAVRLALKYDDGNVAVEVNKILTCKTQGEFSTHFSNLVNYSGMATMVYNDLSDKPFDIELLLDMFWTGEIEWSELKSKITHNFMELGFIKN